MKIACCITAMTCALSTPVLAHDEHVALLKNVTGKVSIVRDAGTFEARPGTTLRVADQLVSAAGASAGIAFKDGTLLTLGPGAELQLRDYAFEPKDARYAFAVHLARGEAIYDSGKIGKLAPQSVKVTTPTATVGVRGTRFIVRAE